MHEGIPQNKSEAFNHLSVPEVMKAYNAYFLHTIQITNALDVSENNQSIDTQSLSVSDKLDILYAAQASISASTVRPQTEDGTFYGGFGVVISNGEITSANPSDDGTVAVSVAERHVIGGNKDTAEDIGRAINRDHAGSAGQKQYNEVVVRAPEVAGGFIKLHQDSRVSYEDREQDYGAGGGVVTQKIGILDLSTVYEKDASGNPDMNRMVKNYNVAFNTLRDMELRGPVFVMDEQNQLFMVQDIDVEKRLILFSTRPFLPSDIADIFGNAHISEERREEMLEELAAQGVVLN